MNQTAIGINVSQLDGVLQLPASATRIMGNMEKGAVGQA